MHIELCSVGPTEVARSKEYDALEIAPDFEAGVVYISGLNREAEEWHDIAVIRAGKTTFATQLTEGGGNKRVPGVYTIFVDAGN